MHPIIQQINDEQIEKLSGGKSIPHFRPGDTIVVNVKVQEGDRIRVQAYEGVVIARQGAGLNESFTVRKISYGEGIERVFPVHTPAIDSIKLVRRGKVRRAKLYYLRDRRGKQARIAERLGPRAHTERLGVEPSGEFKVAFSRRTDSKLGLNRSWREGADHKGYPTLSPAHDNVIFERNSDHLTRALVPTMVSSLKQMQALRGAAEGPAVSRIVSTILSNLSETQAEGARKADVYGAALALGERLCPLMFSRDENVASDAKKCLMRLGAFIAEKKNCVEQRDLITIIQHLDVSIAATLSVEQDESGFDLRLEAKDLLFSVTEISGICERYPVKIELALEDARESGMLILDEGVLGVDTSLTLKKFVIPSSSSATKKIVNVLIDGRESFRSHITKDIDVIFVVGVDQKHLVAL